MNARVSWGRSQPLVTAPSTCTSTCRRPFYLNCSDVAPYSWYSYIVSHASNMPTNYKIMMACIVIRAPGARACNVKGRSNVCRHFALQLAHSWPQKGFPYACSTYLQLQLQSALDFPAVDSHTYLVLHRVFFTFSSAVRFPALLWLWLLLSLEAPAALHGAMREAVDDWKFRPFFG